MKYLKKYWNLAIESRNPLVVILAILGDGFLLLMKTPQSVIEWAIIGVFAFLLGFGAYSFIHLLFH